MEAPTVELDQLQSAYKSAVEAWIAAIREEEARNKVKAAKKEYEDALREKFFNF
jgi:division protein CdvB (Snf7/Vps24/ESCRT-III family)